MEIWYVREDDLQPGEWPELFTTKAAAEAWARELYPNEDIDKRYARVFYRKVNE